jgi:hypothetical protein
VRTWGTILAVALGLALTLGGCGAIYAHQSTAGHVSQVGVRVTGTVTGVRNYHGRGDLVGALTSHVDVAFVTKDGKPAHARLGLADDQRFAIGDRVAVIYDPGYPSHAVLAAGDNGGQWFVAEFVGFILGIGAFALAVKRARATGAARTALREQPCRRSVVTHIERHDYGRSGRDERMVYVLDDRGWSCGFWALSKRRWHLADGLTSEPVVFGTPGPGSVLVVVDPDTHSVAAGRVL